MALRVVTKDGQQVRPRLALLQPAFKRTQSFACWLFSLSGGVIVVGGVTLAAWTIAYSPYRNVYGGMATLACIWLSLRWARHRLEPKGEGVQHVYVHSRRWF